MRGYWFRCVLLAEDNETKMYQLSPLLNPAPEPAPEPQISDLEFLVFDTGHSIITNQSGLVIITSMLRISLWTGMSNLHCMNFNGSDILNCRYICWQRDNIKKIQIWYWWGSGAEIIPIFENRFSSVFSSGCAYFWTFSANSSCFGINRSICFRNRAELFCKYLTKLIFWLQSCGNS